MKTRRQLALTLAVAALAALVPATPAVARRSVKKAIWGPVVKDGRSQFSYYHDLGAGIYEAQLRWNEVATHRPLDPTDPNDPAYAWPSDLDRAQREAPALHIRPAFMVIYTPSWANGGRAKNYAPDDPADYAAFVTAAAKRYSVVHLWMVWGEPTRDVNWRPLTPENRGQPLNAEQAKAPHAYAQLLDQAYVALHGVDPRNRVIGGNSFTTGDISPLNWIKNLKLPDGRTPRMDYYGHNPFTGRKPDLRKPPLRYGLADFSDLDTLWGWLDKYLRPTLPGHPRLKVFLTEFLIPTDHPNYEFNFWVSKKTQASWLKAALKIVRASSRVYSLGWFSLYDEEPNRRHDEVNHGLLDYRGNKKPAYFTYRRG